MKAETKIVIAEVVEMGGYFTEAQSIVLLADDATRNLSTVIKFHEAPRRAMSLVDAIECINGWGREDFREVFFPCSVYDALRAELGLAPEAV